MAVLYDCVKIKFRHPKADRDKGNYGPYTEAVPARITLEQLESFMTESRAFREAEQAYGIMFWDTEDNFLWIKSNDVTAKDAPGAAKAIRDALHAYLSGTDGGEDVYDVRIMVDVHVPARSIGQALERLQESYPDVNAQERISGIAVRGQKLERVYSEKAHDWIWYRPGCITGDGNCLQDPMRKLASTAAGQAEMDGYIYLDCTEHKEPL